uniref:C2 domain-containing protein n=1 Tax=Fagus sylvatica TaxID=28930 RepID=A0A2N9EXZ2_FAGSY
MSRPQLLEINLVSAQDLEPVSKIMHTYAVAWLHPDHKLLTRIDQEGQTSPTWNEKFLFRVDNNFLKADNSAVMIEIYASSWLRDILIGTVRVLISNLLPPTKAKWKMRIVPFHVRRPSGRPQGILNVGVTLLDSNMRNMPVYKELAQSAIGYWDLMDVKGQKKNDSDSSSTSNNNSIQSHLQRSLSELSSFISDKYVAEMNSIDDVDLESLKKGKNVVSRRLPVRSSVESSLVDDWVTEDTSAEGLKSKIARWRFELPPPIYDSSYAKFGWRPRQSNRHARRHSTGGGLFSCFGKAYGFKCAISCGGVGSRSKKKMDDANIDLLSQTEIVDESFM